jgi:chromosome segregation ATPase
MQEQPHSIFPGKSEEEIKNIESQLKNASMKRDDDFTEEKNVHDIIHLHENTEPLNDVAVETMDVAEDRLEAKLAKARSWTLELRTMKREMEVKQGMVEASILALEDKFRSAAQNSGDQKNWNITVEESEKQMSVLNVRLEGILENIQHINEEMEIVKTKVNNINNIFEPKNINLN